MALHTRCRPNPSHDATGLHCCGRCTFVWPVSRWTSHHPSWGLHLVKDDITCRVNVWVPWAWVTTGRLSLVVITVYQLGSTRPLPRPTVLWRSGGAAGVIFLLRCPFVIGGDLNIYVEDSFDINATRFAEVLNTFGLMQYVHESAHQLGGTLDVVNCHYTWRYHQSVSSSQPTRCHFWSWLGQSWPADPADTTEDVVLYCPKLESCGSDCFCWGHCRQSTGKSSIIWLDFWGAVQWIWTSTYCAGRLLCSKPYNTVEDPFTVTVVQLRLPCHSLELLPSWVLRIVSVDHMLTPTVKLALPPFIRKTKCLKTSRQNTGEAD